MRAALNRSAANPLWSPLMVIGSGLASHFAGGLRPKPADALGGTLGRSGALELRLARGPRDIRRAQRLRYQVFYGEMSAKPGMAARMARRDADRFDAGCDHLLVIDHDARGRFGGRRPKVVGTYRLMRQERAVRLGGFYSESEFDLGPLFARHPGLRFLELGRSCVLKPYRTKKTVDLLWHGIWTYVRHHRIDAMFGCASFEGVDPAALALPLSFLHHHARADRDWATAARPERAVGMDLLPSEMVDPKLALKQLPVLIKGYLRVGAKIGDQAVIDRQFGTTDVLVILPVARIDRRYVDYYGETGERYAA